ncbi:MAG: aspartate 1-decarboxylase [Nitrospirota bacterium]
MLRTICKSKIHRVTITETNLHYMGSITIDEELLIAADIMPNERVQIVNLNNGSRVETYVMPGEKGSGKICLNGAAARWGQAGDLVIIISYCLMTDEEAKNYQPKVITVDGKNKLR